jgi:hypothetical protein
MSIWCCELDYNHSNVAKNPTTAKYFLVHHRSQLWMLLSMMVVMSEHELQVPTYKTVESSIFVFIQVYRCEGVFVQSQLRSGVISTKNYLR